LKSKTFAVDIDGTVTENGGGRINLDALLALRHLKKIGHNVIFVSGRSSVEAYLLSVFGGTTQIGVGENGGCITQGPTTHTLLGNIQDCQNAFELLKSKMENVLQKPVFPRMTEIVLERTFDIKQAQSILKKSGHDVELADSQYAYHINSSGVDKAMGFRTVMKMLSISHEDVISIGDSETDVPLFEISQISVALGNSSEQVKSHASMIVSGKSGDGVLEALDILAPKISGT